MKTYIANYFGQLDVFRLLILTYGLIAIVHISYCRFKGFKSKREIFHPVLILSFGLFLALIDLQAGFYRLSIWMAGAVSYDHGDPLFMLMREIPHSMDPLITASLLTFIYGLIDKLGSKKTDKANHGLESTGAPPAADAPETHP